MPGQHRDNREHPGKNRAINKESSHVSLLLRCRSGGLFPVRSIATGRTGFITISHFLDDAIHIFNRKGFDFDAFLEVADIVDNDLVSVSTPPVTIQLF